jgi:hypothetical protein
MLFQMLTAEWLHLVLCFFTEYHNASQNIIILFWQYLIEIGNEPWLNPF